jgi:hypothetical protein
MGFSRLRWRARFEFCQGGDGECFQYLPSNLIRKCPTKVDQPYPVVFNFPSMWWTNSLIWS